MFKYKVSNASKQFNIKLMSGGKLKIDTNVLFDHLNNLIKSNNFKWSGVPHNLYHQKTMLLFDIDNSIELVSNTEDNEMKVDNNSDNNDNIIEDDNIDDSKQSSEEDNNNEMENVVDNISDNNKEFDSAKFIFNMISQHLKEKYNIICCKDPIKTSKSSSELGKEIYIHYCTKKSKKYDKYHFYFCIRMSEDLISQIQHEINDIFKTMHTDKKINNQNPQKQNLIDSVKYLRIDNFDKYVRKPNNKSYYEQNTRYEIVKEL